MIQSPNPNKQLSVRVEGRNYDRYPIHTHFVQLGEDYLELVRFYALHDYEPGDVLCISEKIISICQKNIIPKEQLKISPMARFLSRFACQSSIGIGVNNIYKMQVAINLCGRMKIFYAAVVGGIGKLFGRRGLFYEIAGQEVEGLDGFYGEYFEPYANFGILLPENPEQVCMDIYRTLGIRCIIADINDFTGSILARSPGVTQSDETLYGILKDNPAGNSNQQTPLLLIRRTSNFGDLEKGEEYAIPSCF